MTARLLITAILIAVATNSVRGQQGAPVLMEAARKAEVIDGDLVEAIKQYEAIAATFARSDRAAAASALLRMAECYQKLGDAQATKTYERLLHDYTDQMEAVSIAQARLGAGRGVPSPTTAMRKLWAGPGVDVEGTVSPDGRLLSYADWSTGDLAVRDLSAGTNRRITNKGSWFESGEFAEYSAVSRDGKRIAYAWFNGTDRYEVRVADITAGATSRPRRIFDNDNVNWVGVHDWSPDGRMIAVQIDTKDRTAQVGWISVADGSLHVLRSIDWRGVSDMAFSPDSRYLAFDLATDDTDRQRDVFVIAVDGSRQVPAVAHPGRDVVMGWSPNGRWLLFGSDRGGNPGLWGQAIVDGVPQGQPRLIKPDIGQISLGVSSAGSLFVGSPVGGRDVYVARIDFDSGREVAAVTRSVDTFVGFNLQPDWSPDGGLLAYVSLRNGLNRDRVLAIRSAETGELIRELRPPMTYFQTPRWTPDGQALLASGSDLKGRQGVFRIDPRTGEPTMVAAVQANMNMFGPQLSADSAKIYYRGFVAETNEATLAERDLESGRDRVLFQRAQVSVPSLTRDGRFLTVVISDEKTSSVVVVSTADGRVRELAQGSALRPFVNAPGWIPDGRGVVVARRQARDAELYELVFIPIDGGQPRTLDVKLPAAVRGPIRVHPDGRRITFEAGLQEWEVWALDNFLPTDNTKH